MANQKLLKKVAPVVLSAAMVMTSMPGGSYGGGFLRQRCGCGYR